MNLGLIKRRAAQKSLPYDAELQYIKMNQVVFKMDVFSGNEYELEVVFENIVFKTTTSGLILFGYYNSNGESRYINRFGTSNSIGLNWNKNKTWNPTGIQDVTNKKISAFLSENIMTVICEGESYSTTEASKTITIPNEKTFSVGSTSVEFNLFELKLSNDNGIVYDLIPVRKNGLPYVFNKVTNTFVAGGTEGYTGGPDK